MANRSLDPTRKIVEEFQAGRISRRRFLQLLAAVTGSAAMAYAPTVAARNVARLPLASPARQIEPKVLVYGASQDIATLDPFDREDYSIGAIMRQLYDRLFRFEGGWPQPIEKGLVEKWGVSDDAKEWTFELTDKAKFHDGTPVTAESVAFTYQQTLRHKSSAQACWQASLHQKVLWQRTARPSS